jgi:hypothetical protein
MFATKILVASALAAGSMAFAAQPAQADGGARTSALASRLPRPTARPPSSITVPLPF